MQIAFQNRTSDGTSVTLHRGTDEVIKGVFKYVKTGTGTCTLALKDSNTGAVLSSLSVGAGNPTSAEDSFYLPNSYYAEVSSTSGTFSLDVFVDGGVGGLEQFDPNNIANLVLWLDAADESTITLTSGDVFQWDDKSANANNASGGTTNPFYKLNSLNSLPGVEFRAVSDQLNAGSDTSLDNLFSSGGFVVLVMEVASTSGTRMVFSKNSNQLLFIATSLLPRLQYNFSTTNGDWRRGTSGVVLNTPAILGLAYNSSNVANDPTFYVDGNITASVEDSTPVGTAVSDISDDLFIGSNDSTTRSLNGTIYEFIAYSSTPSSDDITNVFEYLSAKWGIALI